ncbi:hypothetical protein ACKFRH_04670 [Corynebacterium kefirresidentii]|uniref:hypothetical protein n=1 Tax=Corynebacterium TaxID=1716 RepID=UPI0038D151A3
MEKLSDPPIGGLRQNVDFILKLVAGTLSPFGSILAAPQITTLVTSQSAVNWCLLVSGVVLMVAGLLVIPLWLAKRKKNRVEEGTTGRFVKRVDECVRAMNDYSRSNKSSSDKATLYQKLTTEATYIIGNRARVCLYWKSAPEGRSEVRYELVRENAGERNPRAQAREHFCANGGDNHLSFINALDGRSERIVVQDIKKPPSGFFVSANDANEYHSFILVPIRANEGRTSYRKTVGVLTVDFPGKNIITAELELVTSAIAEMFSDTLQIAQNEPFKEDKVSYRNSYGEGIVGMVERQGEN